MLFELMRIVKGREGWKLIFDGKTYDIRSEDSNIMNLLEPSNNQLCVLTETPNGTSVCYFVKTDKRIEIYSYPDKELRVTSDYYLDFFEKLEVGVPYYLTPVQE